MEERPETELISIPATPRASTPEIQTPTGQRSPRPASNREGKASTAWTPTSFISPRFLSPIGTPMKRVLINMKGYLEEMGHLTKLNPQDAWLPITESRNGNAHYAAFHNLNAGVGFQALVLPVAFAFLGWSWGILSLTIAYCWQLYTLWILVQLHEAVPGKRYNRYVELAEAAFGERLGVWLALFPTVYLSAGTATALILIGGETMKLFFQIVCGPLCSSNPLTTVEWYLVFTSLCIVLSQLPNLNSIAGLSLIGAVTAITYSTMVWVLSVSQQRPLKISYEPVSLPSFNASVFSALNALGIVAFAFRGHNLVLEIQATMPSTFKHPAHVPMWRGAKVAYFFIAMCLFPVAIGGYWAYGNLMPSGGMLNALYQFHIQDIPRGLLAMTFLLVVFNCLSSFQIYSMPVFDSFEARSGALTDEHGRVQAIWGSFSTQLKFGCNTSEDHQFVRGIPIYTISQVLDKIISGAKGPPLLINGVRTPMPLVRILEVELYPTLLSKARSFGLSDDWVQALVKKDPIRRQVLRVKGCLAGSQAENLLEQGDMVLAIDKEPVTCFHDIETACQALDKCDNNDGKLNLTIFRQGREIDILVGTDVRDGNGTTRVINWCGCILQDPHPAVRALGFLPEEGHGVYVARWCHGSPVHRYGLYALQWIVEVNGKPTPDLDAFVNVTKELEHGEFVRVRTVHLNGKPRVLTLKQDLHYWPTWELRFNPETAMWLRKTIKALGSTSVCMKETFSCDRTDTLKAP